jgi:hypothetical protein
VGFFSDTPDKLNRLIQTAVLNELNAKSCGLIPSFQNIKVHTMSDINKIMNNEKDESKDVVGLV